MRRRNAVLRYVVIVAALAAVWCTTGCTVAAGDGQVFVQDFVRQVLAAYLF
jgi:hypothetical protein